MARNVAGRLLVAGTLVADTPWHVGGAEEDVATDLPLARNGRGRYYLPGTSMAGVVRAWLEDAFWDNRDQILAICGFQERDDGHASFLMVDDIELPPCVQRQIETRDGVGINRKLGTAHEGVLFNRAIVPRGAECALKFAVEVPSDKDWPHVLGFFGHLLAALQRGEIRLGAARSRGMGRVRLKGEPKVLRQGLDTREAILALVAAREGCGSPLSIAQMIGNADSPRPRARPRLVLNLDWTPLAPVMVNLGVEGLVADSMPLVSLSAGRVAATLPGSSIKGALRCRAEQIVRTVLNLPPLDRFTTSEDFLKMIEAPLVTALFGEGGKPDESTRKLPGEKPEVDPCARPEPGLAALWVDDVYARTTICVKQWASILQARDSRTLLARLKKAGLPDWTPAYHVAVDRWTGGAADGALFSVLEPWSLGWEPIRLTVDLRRLKDDERLPALALLFLTLGDLASPEMPSIPLGYGTNRGMGDIRVDRLNIEVIDVEVELRPLENYWLPGEDLARIMLPEELREALTWAWFCWIEKNGAVLS